MTNLYRSLLLTLLKLGDVAVLDPSVAGKPPPAPAEVVRLLAGR